MLGFGLALLVLALLVDFLQSNPKARRGCNQVNRSNWKREAIWLGLGILVFGLLPVLLVGRTVDFKNFSRYTLIASVGAAIVVAGGVKLYFQY